LILQEAYERMVAMGDVEADYQLHNIAILHIDQPDG
jgi:hypothetical protein